MAKGRAKIAMSQGLSVWVLEAPEGFGDAQFHAHQAIQITVSLAGGLTLSSPDLALSAPALAVAADKQHKLEAHGLLAFIFVEPESWAGRALRDAMLRDRTLVELDKSFVQSLEHLRSTFNDSLPNEALLEAGRNLVEELTPDIQASLPDHRIQRIIDYAVSHLDQPLSLTRASKGIHLSPSRLRHLFVEQTGLPFKSYLLWLRLVRAVHEYSQGLSLTEAAHQAGFADSAHFSRVFRRTFGLPVTALARF